MHRVGSVLRAVCYNADGQYVELKLVVRSRYNIHITSVDRDPLPCGQVECREEVAKQ